MAFLTVHMGHTVLLTVRGSQAVNWFSQRADGIFNSAYGHTVFLNAGQPRS
jgi:hypothetical protein